MKRITRPRNPPAVLSHMAVKTKGKALPQVFAYGAYRHYLDGVQKRGADRGVVTLFRSDSLLSNPRDWLIHLPESRFNKVVSAHRLPAPWRQTPNPTAQWWPHG